jgi:6-phosphogluconolactonase
MQAASPRPRLRPVANTDGLARIVARHVLAHARAAVAARGRFSLVLTGGSTPKGLYQRLAADGVLRARFPWPQTAVYWGDERHVPPTHPDSNYRMAHEALLAHVPIAASSVHRIRAEAADAADAAASYEEEVRAARAADPDGLFDLVLLGMGADGHIASLFPGSPLLHDAPTLVAAPWVPALETHRLTLTPPALLGARAISLLVTGESKAEAVRDVLEGPLDVVRRPAQCLRGATARVTWFIDAAAAGLLSPRASPRSQR